MMPFPIPATRKDTFGRCGLPVTLSLLTWAGVQEKTEPPAARGI